MLEPGSIAGWLWGVVAVAVGCGSECALDTIAENNNNNNISTKTYGNREEVMCVEGQPVNVVKATIP